MALAGFALTLSLVANFVETGKIRHKGDFTGRRAVRAEAIEQGSVIADFAVLLQNTPREVFGIAAAGSASHLLYTLMQRVISRNVGRTNIPADLSTDRMLERSSGDFEALVAISEPSIRQAHSVIDNGATEMTIIGGVNIIEKLDRRTLEYVKANVDDPTPMHCDVTVSAFDANSGYGRIFDHKIGRGIPMSMSKDTLRKLSPIFSWGLDQYANKTGQKVRIWFTRVLAADGRPKRYVIIAAERLIN